MKQLLISFLLFACIVVGCNVFPKPTTTIKDTVWPKLVYDSAYDLDSAGMYYWGHEWDKTTHIHKHIYDSSNWFLISIKDTGDAKRYYYFRHLFFSMVTDGGVNDLVGRWDWQYRFCGVLLDSSSIKDTIPVKENIVIYDDSLKQWTYRSDYFIGGILREYLYSKLDSIVPLAKK